MFLQGLEKDQNCFKILKLYNQCCLITYCTYRAVIKHQNKSADNLLSIIYFIQSLEPSLVISKSISIMTMPFPIWLH